jgi:hypothetical protein
MLLRRFDVVFALSDAQSGRPAPRHLRKLWNPLIDNICWRLPKDLRTKRTRTIAVDTVREKPQQDYFECDGVAQVEVYAPAGYRLLSTKTQRQAALRVFKSAALKGLKIACLNDALLRRHEDKLIEIIRTSEKSRVFPLRTRRVNRTRKLVAQGLLRINTSDPFYTTIVQIWNQKGVKEEFVVEEHSILPFYGPLLENLRWRGDRVVCTFRDRPQLTLSPALCV